MNQVGVIIQAHLHSTRLPYKILYPIYRDMPALRYLLYRLWYQLPSNIPIIAAIPEQDQLLAELISAWFPRHDRIKIFKHTYGDENDVLDRYYEAATQHDLDVIIRVTADCPLIPPTIIMQMTKFLIMGNFDYVTNIRRDMRRDPPTLHTTFPQGCSCEVFTYESLVETWHSANKPHELEHVTQYMWQSNKFKWHQINILGDYHHIRLTLDTYDDYLEIKQVAQKLGFNFTLKELIETWENLYSEKKKPPS